MQGHPFRIRYDVPLVAACAALAGAGIGLLWSRVRPIAAALVVAVALVQAPPLDRTAPLVVESQRDAAEHARAAAPSPPTSRALRRPHDHDEHGIARPLHARPVGCGFRIHDFLHEGNGEIWNFAMLRPARASPDGL